jgi:ribosomal protein S18 acetylase RimI-like enzyme
MHAYIRLETIAESEFADFLESLPPWYAEERSAADRIPKAVAERYARQQHAELLPQGYQTPGHRFFRIVEAATGQPVGSLWLRLDAGSGEAYLYSLLVAPDHRRKGYASAALDAVARLARAAGCARLALNVFAHNAAAQALYRKLGFQVVSLRLLKPLPDPEA